MSRLSDAWAALCGRPRVIEKQVPVYLPGPASFVDVFKGDKWPGHPCHGPTSVYYATCAQAHTECGGDIVKVRAVKFDDGKLYLWPEGWGLRVLNLQPKPKRAKGAKA